MIHRSSAGIWHFGDTQLIRRSRIYAPSSSRVRCAVRASYFATQSGRKGRSDTGGLLLFPEPLALEPGDHALVALGALDRLVAAGEAEPRRLAEAGVAGPPHALADLAEGQVFGVKLAKRRDLRLRPPPMRNTLS